MGMDLTGITPNGETMQFRASVWAWRPIHYLCDNVNRVEELNLDLKNWEYNSGAGLATEEDCKALAKGLEVCLEHIPVDIIKLETFKRDGENYQCIVPFDKSDEFKADYRVPKEHVQEFIEFLKQVREFHIW